jgi:hypothetical protein
MEGCVDMQFYQGLREFLNHFEEEGEGLLRQFVRVMKIGKVILTLVWNSEDVVFTEFLEEGSTVNS